MDVKITGGDIVLDSCGSYVYISGLDEAVQQVRMIALTSRGSFLYDRSLGMEYDAFSGEETDPVGKLDMLLKEAAAGLSGVDTEVLSYDPETDIMTIKVTYYGRSAVTEVDISGNI